jgi:hypothetical protein
VDASPIPVSMRKAMCAPAALGSLRPVAINTGSWSRLCPRVEEVGFHIIRSKKFLDFQDLLARWFVAPPEKLGELLRRKAELAGQIPLRHVVVFVPSAKVSNQFSC